MNFEKEQIIEYLRRSYFAVDGLWFTMRETEEDFETALELDKKVWTVLPKIQARKAKELLSLESHGIENLKSALALKFTSEQYQYTITHEDKNRLELLINECPWYVILKKTDRLNIGPRIAGNICAEEFETWAWEFKCKCSSEPPKKMCCGHHFCLLNFTFPAEDK